MFRVSGTINILLVGFRLFRVRSLFWVNILGSEILWISLFVSLRLFRISFFFRLLFFRLLFLRRIIIGRLIFWVCSILVFSSLSSIISDIFD